MTAKTMADFFMNVLLSPVCFLIILIVQLKIIRTLNSHTSMIMFYGKQIEELRRAVAGSTPARRIPEVAPDEQGLYEVLNE